MEYNREKLKELYEKAARKRKLAAELTDLEEQKAELEYNAETLRGVMELEEEDVKRLEKASISNFFIELSGRMGEKMNQERREAYAAATKYHAAAAELENIEKAVAAKQKEYDAYGDCEKELDAAIAEAVEAAKDGAADDDGCAAKIVEIEQAILRQESKIRELGEAIVAGNIAAEYVDPVMKNLDSAENWGAFDLFGGGIISSIAKHEKLNQAQHELENLYSYLSTFRNELADVNINFDADVTLDSFTTTADWLFDGFFIDGFVLNKIQGSKQRIYELRQEIYNLIDRLEAERRQAEAEKSRLTAALEQVAVG